MARLGLASAAAVADARRVPPNLGVRDRGADLDAPFFLDAVRRRLEAALGRERLLTGGLEIHTTLRPMAQRSAQQAVAAVTDPDAEAALVMLAPGSREVLALVGGRDFARSQFNRALQARRQAGSTFKPVVYGAGIEAGLLTAQTRYPNKRVAYRGAHGAWRPANHDGRHDGALTAVADALARSLNVVAVQALADVGVARATDFARRLGIRSPIAADLTLALGSVGVTPLELANAYATLASGGLRGEPVFVRRVEGPDGRVLYAERADPGAGGRRRADRHAPAGRPRGDRAPRGHRRPRRRGQDRHDQWLRGRVVRRLHPRGGGRRLGWARRRPAAAARLGRVDRRAAVASGRRAVAAGQGAADLRGRRGGPLAAISRRLRAKRREAPADPRWRGVQAAVGVLSVRRSGRSAHAAVVLAIPKLQPKAVRNWG
jgi:hypothetical protein